MKKDTGHIVLVGAGIMSASLGVFLRKLMPGAQISIFESLDRVAAESSDVWNNAGTGHSAYCELNYTPDVNGKVEIDKALEIAHHFEISKQLWAYLKESNAFTSELSFIHPIPHMSFVWGNDNVDFLQRRYQAMRQSHMFESMKFSNDREEIRAWVPLLMDGRGDEHALAATRMDAGSDVNFGAITHGIIDYLAQSDAVELHLGHSVEDFEQLDDGRWEITIKDKAKQQQKTVIADCVFIGAGGGTLPLLEKTGIEEANGYGGFPISGQFLHCDNPNVVSHHHAKVYGKAAVGSPPMSVPHLDTRFIDGRQVLFFGPYAGFSTKFLKHGSYMDLPLSIEMHNVWPLLSAGYQNLDLTKYLIKQVTQTAEQRFEELKTYYPLANMSDWKLIIAGQRVQIIKKDKNSGGVLKFGTEIVSSADGAITALLGASPGASTSVSIALSILQHMFPDRYQSDAWQQAIKTMIPSFGESLTERADLFRRIQSRSHSILGLN